MLRHTTRSLARLSLRNGRCLNVSAQLRAPEVEHIASTSTREATLALGIVNSSTNVIGEGSNGKTPVQTNTNVKWHKVNELYEWDWFRDPLYDSAEAGSSDIAWTQLSSKLQSIQNRREQYDVDWLNQHHEMARSYRIARARLWTPKGVILTEKEIEDTSTLRLEWLKSLLQKANSRLATLLETSQGTQTMKNAHSVSEVRKLNASIRHTSDRISAFNWTGRERAIDDLYKEHWIKLTDEQRRDDMLRVRYECARRVGWRKGYTSGYPQGSLQDKDEASYVKRGDLLEGLGSKKKSEVNIAVERLSKNEEAAAWQAWISMDKATRREEEKAAWDLRDRSLIYTDDSAHILDQPEPRWYSQPQKVGSMVFLPNVVVRLVRNTKTRHGGYDAFKATFRVPLSMHKHSLRSYLLAIYGLRTTWCRSSIYRASIVRDKFRRKRIGSAKRTFKKVEVGILEPFLFPEITPKFQSQHMRKNEMKSMQAKSIFRATGARRWRAKSPIRSATPPRRNSSAFMLEDDDTPLPKKQELPKVKNSTRIINTGGIVTKKRNKILRLIHKKNLEREKEVAHRMNQLKREQTLQQS